MANTVSTHLQDMFSKMENFISTKTVVGEAIHFGDVIVVPLVEVSFGVFSGMGEGNNDKDEKKAGGTGGGGGMGSRLTPAAVIVIVNGTVQLVDVKNKESVNKLIDMIPGVLSKLNLDGIFGKKDDKDEHSKDDHETDIDKD